MIISAGCQLLEAPAQLLHSPLYIWMILYFLDCYSSPLIYLQTAHDQILQILRNRHLESPRRYGFSNVQFELTFDLAEAEGWIPMQHLIQEHPERPYIGLGTVDTLQQPFRRHVDGTAHVNILEVLTESHTLLPGALSKSEIGYLGNTILEENIGDLYVSVDDVVLRQVEQACVDVADQGPAGRLF